MKRKNGTMEDPAAGGVEFFLPVLQDLHRKIRNAVLQSCLEAEAELLAQVVAEEPDGDTIYAIDRISEELLLSAFEEISLRQPLLLIAEGLPNGQILLPKGTREEDARWRVIMDPIDGTRCLMYQKRSAWILTAVAPNLGPATHLQDIELAIQTEIPLIKQHLGDTLWAFKHGEAQAQRWNRITHEIRPLALCPSRSRTIAHGYAMLSRFFPGAREVLAEMDEEIVMRALGPFQKGKAHCFEDQYTSTAGQLYELISGHDRFNADLRPLMEKVLARRGLSLGICCHPYDICTELIARKMGVLITDEWGSPLTSRLSVEPDVTWIGFANESIRQQMEPLLREAIRSRGLLS